MKSVKRQVYVIKFGFPSGSTMYFYESLKREFCLTPDPEHATHFPTKLAGEEYLLNLRYTNAGNAVIEKFEVVEHHTEVAV